MFTYLQENHDFKNILEFGFNVGHSSTWFLYAFPNAKVVSFDPKERTISNVRIWQMQESKFENRFRFRPNFSTEAIQKYQHQEEPFDIVFVDAGHTFGAVYDDIETALHLKIPLILIDNMELEPQKRAVAAWKENLQFTKQFKYYTINNDGNTYERYVNLYNVLSYDIQKPV